MFTIPTDYKYPGPSSPSGAEPMNLGSPVSSPTRNAQSNINFLPPYLIREAVPHTSPTSPGWTSPVSIHSTYIPPQMSPSTARKTLFHSAATTTPLTPVISSSSVVKSGPPVESLFDAVTSPQSSDFKFMKLDESTLPLGTPNRFAISSLRQHEQSNISGILTPNKSFEPNSSAYMSPAQIDPFYTQGESLLSSTQLDESWITIFGFPPASVSYILQQFSHYGKIMERKVETPGNWIHIRYQSKLQAKKALSKNGKVFGTNIMVGVKPCIEMELMNESCREKENESDLTALTDVSQDVLDIENLDTSHRSLQNIRPLTEMYMSPTASGTPKAKIERKTNGFVTKAIEYVLKW